MASLVVVGGVRTDSISVKVYDDTGDGTPDLSLDLNGTARGVALDADGKIYGSGSDGSNLRIAVWDADGNSSWTKSSSLSGANGHAIHADDDGNAYVAESISNDLAKYNASGTQQWTKSDLADPKGVFVSPAGRIYNVGGYYLANITCHTADGTRLWRKRVNSGSWTIYDVATADDVSIYVVGERSYDIALFKLSRDDDADTLTTEWSKDHSKMLACAMTPNGGVAIAGLRSAGNLTTFQYDADGNLEWSADHGDDVYGIAVDSIGNVYTTGDRVDSKTTRKYSPDGTLLYSFDFGANTLSIDIQNPQAVETSAPGLPIPFDLAMPVPGPTAGPAGIPLRLALALPGVTPTPLPPDLALLGPYPPQVYRLYLATEDVQELPLAEITCRRRLGASTWMTCRVPTADADIRADCLAHIGGEILVYAGVSDGGTETLGEFLRAVLTEVDSERDGRSGSITLTGRVQNPSYASAERTLLAVQSRGLDGERHTAVCAVDPLLKPNDEVDDGADTWTVGNLEYRINSTMSQMRVTEDG